MSCSCESSFCVAYPANTGCKPILPLRRFTIPDMSDTGTTDKQTLAALIELNECKHPALRDGIFCVLCGAIDLRPSNER